MVVRLVALVAVAVLVVVSPSDVGPVGSEVCGEVGSLVGVVGSELVIGAVLVPPVSASVVAPELAVVSSAFSGPQADAANAASAVNAVSVASVAGSENVPFDRARIMIKRSITIRLDPATGSHAQSCARASPVSPRSAIPAINDSARRHADTTSTAHTLSPTTIDHSAI